MQMLRILVKGVAAFLILFLASTDMIRFGEKLQVWEKAIRFAPGDSQGLMQI